MAVEWMKIEQGGMWDRSGKVEDEQWGMGYVCGGRIWEVDRYWVEDAKSVEGGW